MADTAALLSPVVAHAVLGRSADLRAALDAALDARCVETAVREALLMVALFAGYPRTLDALAVWESVLLARGAAPPGDAAPEDGLPEDDGARRELFRRRGDALFRRVYGADAERVMTRLLALDPELPGWVLEDAYGRVLARPGLDAADRELLAVVMLCALGLRNQLSGHVRGALHCGASPDDVRECVAAAGAAISPENAAEALGALPG